MELFGAGKAHKKMLKEMADDHNKKIGPPEPTEKEKAAQGPQPWPTQKTARDKYGIGTGAIYD